MSVAKLCRHVCLSLAACLPFLVPFAAVDKNIELQSYVLVIAGLVAAISLSFQWEVVLQQNSHKLLGLLGLFFLICAGSMLHNPHIGYDLLGAPYIRLGLVELLACLSCALVLQTVPLKKLLVGLYSIIVCSAIVSVPYDLIRYHSLWRLGGLFAQADVFAVLLGCGLIIGCQLYISYPKRKLVILYSQVVLLALLVLTQTRSVLYALALLLPFVLQYGRPKWPLRRWAAYALVVIVLVGVGRLFTNRVTNVSYAVSSVSYRLELQQFALHASWHKPLLGYGLGNLADALDCRNTHVPDLVQTCDHGFFFNSSHNIFLDRIVSVGWLGGLIFFGFVLLCLYRGFRLSGPALIFAWCGLLIGLYYLTNVTSSLLELLFWIALLRAAKNSPTV